MAVIEIVDGVGRLIIGLFGVRYLVSKKYRAEVHTRWEGKSKLSIVGEIFGSLLGLVILGLIIYAIVYLMTSS